MEDRRQHDKEVLEKLTELGTHFKEPHGIIPRIDSQVQKTNGNVKKNTEFRQRAEGIIGSARFIGFSNIIMILVIVVGGLLIGSGYFDKTLSQNDIKNIGDYIVENYDI